MSRTFVGFLVVGVVAGLVNVLARALLSTAMPYELAVAVAFPIALTTAFVLNRGFVFEKGERTIGSQYTRFALVNLVALVQVWIVSVALARIVFPAIGLHFYPELIAHIVGVGSPLAMSFFAYKHFIFGKSGRAGLGEPTK